jgi:hypothetical protein
MGTVTVTQSTISRLERGPQLLDPWMCWPARDQALQHRAHVVEQFGHPGQVGEHVVAVEPDARQELLGGLDVHEQDPGSSQVASVRRYRPVRTAMKIGVEVDAREVRAQASDPVQAVGVGHRAVEGRPDEVQADPHVARTSPAVAARRDVADLVEGHREDQEREEDEGQLRSVDQRRRARRDAAHEVALQEDERVQSHEGGQGRHPCGTPEEQPEDAGDAPRDLCRDHAFR